MKRVFFILLLISATMMSCRKGSKLNPMHGKLVDRNGFDGCGWVIEVDQSQGGMVLEPVNLNEFDVSKVDGQRVSFSYRETNMSSVCMMGKVVKITSIEEE